MIFGKNFTIERQKRKLSSRTIAKAIGVSYSYISLIESGARLPGKNTLIRIAHALQIEKQTVVKWYLDDLQEQLK